MGVASHTKADRSSCCVIVFDENLSPALAHFLEAIAEPARHVRDMGLVATPDEQILERLTTGLDCLLTRDRSMLHRTDVVALLHRQKLGFFVVPSQKQQILETSALVLRHWPQMIEISKVELRPFVAELSLRGPLRMERKFSGR
jgi:hypothetical protein